VNLFESDAKEIPAQCPDVDLAAPYIRGGAQVINGNNNWATQVYGVTPDYLTIRQLSVTGAQSLPSRMWTKPTRLRYWARRR
jgi:putative ABC transport system permease protein